MVTPFYNCLNYLDTSPPPAKAHPPHLCPKAARALDRDRVTVTTKSDAAQKRAAVRDRTRTKRRKRAKRVTRRATNRIARAAARKSEANRDGAADRKRRAASGSQATPIGAVNAQDARKHRRIETQTKMHIIR